MRLFELVWIALVVEKYITRLIGGSFGCYIRSEIKARENSKAFNGGDLHV